MAIYFEKVDHLYEGINSYDNITAIKNINLKIESKNEFIGVIGKTGSGKSTLILHMNGLLIPTNGVVYIDDFLLKKTKRKIKNINIVRKKVGLVFQFPEYQLFEETIIKDVMFGPKNLGFSKEESYKMAKEALKMVNIEENLFQKSPLNLSGGQMRRVAIAGILAIKPEILILDEPTRGLDPHTKKEIMNLFKYLQEKENISIIMISHDMDLVYEYCKRVIVLKDGEIKFDGDKLDLFSNENLVSYALEKPELVKIMDYLENIYKNKKFNRDKIFNELQLLEELKTWTV